MNTATEASHPDEIRTGTCPFAGHVAATAGGHDVEVAAPGDLWRDRPIIEAIDRWSTSDAPEGLALARLVTQHVRGIGQHFLSEPILTRLSEVRRLHGARDGFLAAFLDTILDKYDGRYHNRTYLALPLLERIVDDPRSGLDPVRMSALLMADVIRFELAAAGAESERGNADRPDPLTLRKRITHALRFVAGCRDAATGDQLHDREIGLEELPGSLPTPPPSLAGEWFGLTVQPVYTAHDEYFFIRCLQTHEMVFTVLAEDLRAATRALRAGSFEDALARLNHANAVFARAAMLFRIVATMRAEQFHAFREFTQGASAIQSEQYKRFEIACGEPSAARLESDAFANVPAVKADAAAGHDSLSQAYLDTRRDGTFGPREWELLDARLSRLESAHQRWKSTHRSIAARMLGAASGSGHTSGVPYLQQCLSNRLFWQLGDTDLDGAASELSICDGP